MREVYIKLAELIVCIRSRYPFIERFCADYLTEPSERVDITAEVTDLEISDEISAAEVKMRVEYAECLCIYRNIAEKLPIFDRFVMHGAAVKHGERAYVFTAPSGTGKTTHLRLWQKYLGDSVCVINGDKPILKIENDEVTAYGTAWAGKERLGSNTNARLKAICILKRGKENKIYKVDPKEYFAVLLNQIYLPENEKAAKKNLELFSRLVSLVPVYVLECDMSENAVKTSFEALTGQKYQKRGNDDEN